MSTLFQPKIFLSRRFAAADMPLGEILAERFLHFPVQVSVNRIKPFGNVFMYGRLLIERSRQVLIPRII